MFLPAHAKHFVEEGVFPFSFFKEGILWNIRLLTPITSAALGKLKHSLVFVSDIQIKSASKPRGMGKKKLQVWSSSKEIVSQFRTAQEGPLFKSKMEIKGLGYVQEIIKAFFKIILNIIKTEWSRNKKPQRTPRLVQFSPQSKTLV